MAVFVGFAAAPAAPAAVPPTGSDASAIMLELTVVSPQAGVPFDVIATVQAVPPATGTPQGTVELSVDGEPNSSAVLGAGGTATFTVEVGTAGSHELEAQYLGDFDFAPSMTQSVFATGAAPDPGGNVPSRPQIPRARGGSSDPDPPEPSTPPPAPPVARPSEMAFTGAFTLPGLLIGLSSIGLGLGCRRFARGRLSGAQQQ
jgi:hypothetical protein